MTTTQTPSFKITWAQILRAEDLAPVLQEQYAKWERGEAPSPSSYDQVRAYCDRMVGLDRTEAEMQTLANLVYEYSCFGEDVNMLAAYVVTVCDRGVV